MTLLSVQALGLTRADTLFSDLTFTLSRGDRLGIVAANGRGKSTLLRILSGADDATTGTITRSRGATVGLLPQEVPGALLPLPFRAAALSLLDPDTAATESWRADIAMDDIAVPDALRDRKLAELSGGWQRIALLTRLAVAAPDLWLLDEPTNHLDLARIGQVERFLTDLPGDTGLIVASHDRAFLDRVTSRTLFLRPERSRVFALPYSRAKDALAESDAADRRQADNDISRAKQLRRQAAKLKNIGINSGSDLLVVKTRQLTERADRIEAQARPIHREARAGDIRLDTSAAQARALVSIAETTITTPDGRPLYRVGRLWIGPGDRVVVLGPNGAGKSRLLSRIAAAAAATETESGTADAAIRVAPSVRPGLSDQTMTQLDGDATPFAAITRRFDVGDERARALLAGVGIAVAAQGAPLGRLSGGQRARLAMLVLRLERPNLYILDEPTNHLDIAGQEALEEELAKPDIAAIMVSHDRSFVRATGTRFWEIAAGRLTEVDSPEPAFAAALSR